ncbi:hypothetical protein EPO34_04780 [Patescibacteria group bacterium]|nr:MAG: hypothetical protein EPO34_04780 [Patescibacteria group bacterium]
MKASTKNGGYSLIGVLLYVAIASASLFALASLFRSGLETSQDVRGALDLREAMSFALDRVQERLEEAGAVTTPGSGTSETLSMDAPDPSDAPVTFFVSAGRLMLQLGAQEAQPVTPEDVTVTAFTAERLAGSPASVRVTLSLSRGAIPIPAALTSSVIVTLRYD